MKLVIFHSLPPSSPHCPPRLTESPKCSTAPRPVSPSTPNDKLSSRKIGTWNLLRSSTWGRGTSYHSDDIVHRKEDTWAVSGLIPRPPENIIHVYSKGSLSGMGLRPDTEPGLG